MKYTAAITTLLAACNALVVRQDSCTSPTTRREWRALSDTEKSDYIEAVQCLKTKPSRLTDGSSDSLYDDFANVHRQLNAEIHFVGGFLPWHRWFVLLHEQALQEECNYTGNAVYWDWTQDAADAETAAASPVFDTTTGFGGNGDSSTNCVVDGPFANLNVSTPDTHCLQRVFDMSLIVDYGSQSAVDECMNLNAYSVFRPLLESSPHRSAHAAVAGDMAQSYSPNDPLFFLHHGMIDKIWFDWQSGDESRRTEYAGNRYQNDSSVEVTLADLMPMVSDFASDQVPVSDVMWVQSGILCYTYEE